ncbi:hypothetical protein F4802DRAFT_514508 [Xylaria palmicola]|nr:hypothetical protein F4802DRAFT_514508 [Xylaria palmicola]
MDFLESGSGPRTRRSTRKSSKTVKRQRAEPDALLDTATRRGRKRRTRTRSSNHPSALSPPLAQTPSFPPTRSPDPPEAPLLPTGPTRKRKSAIASDGDTDQGELKRVRLTRKNLARFNKMSGTSTESPHASSAEDDPMTAETPDTSVTSFVAAATKNGLLLDLSQAPANLEDISTWCSKRRGSIGATESDFQTYRHLVNAAPSEATIVVHASRCLLKVTTLKDRVDEYREYGDEHNGDESSNEEAEMEEEKDEVRRVDLAYLQGYNVRLTCFPKDVGFNNGLKTLQPDFIEGLNHLKFYPFPIRDVRGAVVGLNQFAIGLPHLAGEWKKIGKNMDVAKIQSAYDGAACVFARNSALRYLGKSDPPGYARVITYTLDGETLRLYANYASRVKGGPVEYHQYLIESYSIMKRYEDFEAGRRALRNMQDYAKTQAVLLKNKLRRYAMKREKLVQQGLGRGGTSSPQPSPKPSGRGRGRPSKAGAAPKTNTKAARAGRQQAAGPTAGTPKRRGRPPKRAQPA